MAVVDNAAGITIDSSGQHMNSKVLDGLPAASATGQAVRYDEAVVTAGTHAFTAVQSGVAAAAAANLTIRTDLDQVVVSVAAATTAALPAYTGTGGPGAGYTLTANANGAFPTLDAWATVTAAASGEPPSARFLFHNGAANTDNGVYVLTQQGSAGTPWIAVRYTGLDTAAKIPGSRVYVMAGAQSGGGDYRYRARAAITMGTTNLFWWRMDRGASPNEVVNLCNTDFNYGSINTASSAVTTENFTESVSGTGATVSISASNSSATRRGILVLTSGTTTTGKATFQQFFTQNNVYVTTNTGFHIEGKLQLPTLSDGTNTYSVNVGFMDTSTAAPTNCICLSFQPAVNSTNWLVSCSAAATPTNRDTGRTIVAATDDTFILHKDPGDNTIYIVVNGTEVTNVTTNIPTNTPMGLVMTILKSAGTTSRTVEIDYLRAETYDPTRRAS